MAQLLGCQCDDLTLYHRTELKYLQPNGKNDLLRLLPNEQSRVESCGPVTGSPPRSPTVKCGLFE